MNVVDTDGDRVKDGDELNVYRTDPLDPDTEGDGVPDGVEDRIGTNATDPSDGDDDSDGDGIANIFEIRSGTFDPALWDTDGNGLSDGADHAAASAPGPKRGGNRRRAGAAVRRPRSRAAGRRAVRSCRGRRSRSRTPCRGGGGGRAGRAGRRAFPRRGAPGTIGGPMALTAPTLRCFGAVRTVTGSMHLVEANGDKVLLDCGLFQGRRALAREKNKTFPFDPREVTTLVLSHAHIDHAGNIPNLVKQGFRGEIVCTSATRDLAEIMLEDSAAIQEKDAEFLNKKLARRGEALVEPLYTVEDARACVPQFRGVPYHHEVEVARGMRVEFRDAGHILGSASIGLTIEAGVAGRAPRRLTFTGDVGRAGMPIIRDPEPPPAADLAITESTYGDRVHPPIEDQERELLTVVKRTAERGGKLIVPAFSVGRTQNLVYHLHRLFLRGDLPSLPIYVDSPLSSKATMVYRAHPECYDAETQAGFLSEGRDPFGFKRLVYITAVELSKALNDLREPCVIIASSGMCEAGRILHHLKNNVGDARNTVLIIGFQAEHTLGRRLVEKAPVVKIYGEDHEVKAEVVALNGLSAHADRDGLAANFRGERRCAPRALLVHGEVPQCEALRARLVEAGVEARIPEPGQKFDI